MEVEETAQPESISDALRASFDEAETTTEVEAATDGIPDEGAVKEDVEPEVGLDAADESQSEEVTEQTVEPVDGVFQAPEHWSSDEKTAFADFSPEVQEILLAKDKQYQQGYQEKAKGIAAISEALEPWKDALAQRGVTADQAIRTLFAAQNQIDANPLQGILTVAQSYGILDQMREHFAPQTDDDDFTDPEVKALKQEISELKRQVGTVTTGQDQQRVNSVMKQVEDFRTATSDNGKLLHPHFEKVKDVMAGFVTGGYNLQKAYEEAVWTVPEFRKAQLKTVPGETAAEKAARVKRAKRAARGVTPNGKPDPEDKAAPQSRRDDIAAAFHELST